MNSKIKIAVYVDGFNLYHGIKKLSKSYLKWVNPKSLAEKFINNKTEIIENVYYQDLRKDADYTKKCSAAFLVSNHEHSE